MMKKFLCRMCLVDSDDVTKIFTEKFMQSRLAAMIGQHFWFEPKIDDPVSNMLCIPCMQQIESFHKYYQTIEEAQQKLAVKVEEVESSYNPSYIEMNELLKVEDDTNNSLDTEVVDCLEGSQEQAVVPICSNKPCFEEHFLTSEIDDIAAVAVKEEIISNELMLDAEADSDSEPLINLVKKRKKDDAYIPSQSSSDSYSDHGKTPRNTGPSSKKVPAKAKPKKPRKRSKQKDPKTIENQKICEDEEEKIREWLQLKCDLCGQSDLQRFCEVVRHFRDQHNSRGYVRCCSKKFYKRQMLVDHVDLHLNPESFKCEICNKKFVHSRGLKVHMFIKHEANESNAYKCEHCPRLFAKPYLLQKHSLIHTPVELRRNFCEDCGKGFPSDEQKEIHRRNAHNKSKKGHMCHICGKVILDKNLFVKHQLKHAGIIVPRVQCKICSASVFKENLRKHMLVHDTGEYTCSVCGKVCPTKSSINQHVRNSHTIEAKFTCSVCSRGFKRAIALKEHMAIHTGERVYTCQNCPKTFNSHANMHSHRKKMHPNEWAEDRRIRQLNKQTQAGSVVNNDLAESSSSLIGTV